ncbi:MAG: phenylalanine--tRNA ligase subunit beta [Bdellovibrionales bacterium]|nr:phenylalanine--tRNA ligase subunit beta [Bdellovibrionales bacterium]
MKISYQWLNEWVDLSAVTGVKEGPVALAELLTARGLEVESIHKLAEGLDKVVTVRILERAKHPEADRLSICKVTTGIGELMEIVCGAQNMKAGDIVCLAQIGAVLPNGMKIEKSKIRGVVSNGMLCSETELGFKDQSDGILVMPENTPLGWKLADVLGLDDTVFEIKLTANRGDCLSHRGMAREIAAALSKPLKPPKVAPLDFKNSPIAIELEAGEDAPQFFGCYISNVKVGPSPKWLKQRLESIGQRSINNLVDVGNFLMFEYGFPVHIYDADKLEGGVIKVRRSKAGEKLLLLDGQTIETTGEELVIADGKKPVGLAGVMGGGNSEVSDSTKNVFLECAEFNPTLVRRAAFRFSRRSEASLRFEKGVDPAGHRDAIARLSDLVIKVASTDKSIAEMKGSTFKQLPSRASFKARQIQTTTDFIDGFLGTDIEAAKMVDIFKRLDCGVEISGNKLVVTSPTYRLDLNIREDLAEEVARTIGYDAIPTTIPVLTGMPSPKLGDTTAHRLKTIDRMKDAFAESGMNEIVAYSFQSEAWLKKFGFESSVKVLNPLSEEQAAMVPSLLPGLMGAYLENQRHHFGSSPLAVRLFEIRPVFEKVGDIKAAGASPLGGEMETGVRETWKISFLISGPRYDQAMKQDLGEVDFYDLKSVVEDVFESVGTKGVRMRAADSALLAGNGGTSNLAQLFHPGQTVQMTAGKEALGFFGRIHPKLEGELKLRNTVYWGELTLDPVIALTPQKEKSFKAWSPFPTMERDFALLVEQSVTSESLVQSALKHGKPIAKVVKIFDTYKGAHIPEGKISIGVRVIFSEETKSLEEKQVDQCSELIVKKWAEEFGATLR